jgi:hypothetical protein
MASRTKSRGTAAGCAAALWLGCQALTALAQTPEPPSADAPQPPRTAWVMSGGNSLGAYQAGVAYALIHDRQRRRHDGEAVEPLAVAGTSIGALNALAAAAEECTDTSSGRLPAPEESLLWKVWQQLEWGSMFPADVSCDAYKQQHPEIAPVCMGDAPYDLGDGLLSSNQTKIIARTLLQAFNSRSFRHDCHVSLAMALLGAAAQPIDATASKLGPFSVKTSRRLATVRIDTPPGPAGTATTLSASRVDVTPSGGWRRSLSAELRPLVIPHVAGNDVIALTSLVDVAVAAISQPPYLVTPPLVACDVDCPIVSGAAGLCPAGQNLCADRYYDAAIFDRVPLAAGLLLAPMADQYVIVDPARRTKDAAGRRTKDAPPDAAVDLSKLRGLAFLEKAAAGVADSASDYQLQIVQRLTATLDATDRPVVKDVERTFPLAGDNLFGFAGYLDRRFRAHDFYVGIVDGLLWTEAARCSRARARANGPQGSAPAPACTPAGDLQALLDDYANDILDWSTPAAFQKHADLRRSAGLMQVLWSTLIERRCDGDDSADSTCKILGANRRLLADNLTARAIRQIGAAAAAAETAPSSDRASGAALARPLHDARFDDTDERSFSRSHAYWLANTERQLAARASTIEADQGDKLGAGLLGFGEYAASVGVERMTPGFQMGPASIPAQIYGSGLIPGLQKALIPYVIATDVLGGAKAEWEAMSYRLNGAPRWKLLTAGATLNWMRYRDLSNRVLYGPSLSTSFGFRNPWLSEIGLRTGWHTPFLDRRGVTGELFVRPLFGRLELSVGTTQIACDQDCRLGGGFITVGIADFNGILYWLLRGGTGSDSAYKTLVSNVEGHIPGLP